MKQQKTIKVEQNNIVTIKLSVCVIINRSFMIRVTNNQVFNERI